MAAASFKTIEHLEWLQPQLLFGPQAHSCTSSGLGTRSWLPSRQLFGQKDLVRKVRPQTLKLPTEKG